MTTSDDAFAQRFEQHQAAVNNSLGWAQESADHGDYAGALGWIEVLDAIGEPIPPHYEAKRRDWQNQVVANRNDRGQP